MVWLVLAALGLAALAGLAGAAEVALSRLPRAGAQPPGTGASGLPAPGPLQSALADPARYLSLLLVVRACAEAGAVVMAAVVAARLLGPGWRAYLVAAAAMAAVLYVTVGLWPRSIGRGHERRVAGAAAAILYPAARLLGPLPRWLLALGGLLTPGKGAREGALPSEEEWRGLVDMLEQRRVIEPGERRMIHSVFELGDTIVREVMVPRTDIVFVERDKTVQQALSLALRSGFSRIPVVGENKDDVVGVAYLKDLVARSRERPGQEAVEPVEAVMRPATYVPESKPVDALLREMQARQIHQAIVIDEYGGTAGLVTIEDILEEIVGEIADEYDQEQPTVNWLSPGRARVTARLPVADLEELFGVRIEAEDVETVGGLLAQALGRVPIAGSVAQVAGLTLTAESRAGRRNRIATVAVERAPQSRQDRDGQTHDDRAGKGAPGRAGPAGRGNGQDPAAGR